MGDILTFGFCFHELAIGVQLSLSDIELVHTEVFTPDAINNVIFEQPREHQFKCFYNIEDKEMIIETAVFNVEGDDEDLGMREWSETSRNGSFIK